MDELKHIAPGLSKMARENPFRTPPHYFDDFPARLQMKIEAEIAATELLLFEQRAAKSNLLRNVS